MSIVEHPVELYDFHGERFARHLWVNEALCVPYPEVRALKLAARATELRKPKPSGRPRLGYNVGTYEAEEKLRAAKKNALSTKLEVAPRKDVYVKGAQDWEKNCWKVWDKKKAQEEQRRDRYSTAITSYCAGNKLVGRFEPPAVTQCAHCDIGGGLHPLRRCMGCMAVAYCCRMHQKKHWEWHKHICFAIRAANNLEAKRGEGAGWCKLRPRRWRRPPVENGAIVETNVRARWANWKQFYTNGAQSMLNQMGDGGPFVLKEWDEAVASMAMCEEATFVFSVGATQRAMMPFVACRKAPPGTVLVCEVGLINVKRNGGRDQEVNDFLTAKFVAEARQKKLDRLDEQKFMRLRMKQDRKDKADTAMKLLKQSLDVGTSADALAEQKDSDEFGAEEEPPADGDAEGEAQPPSSPAPAATGHAGGSSGGAAPPPPAAAAAAAAARAKATPASPPAKKAGGGDDAEEWEEAPAHDYEAFGEGDDFFLPEGDGDAEPLNIPSAFDDDDDFFSEGGGGEGGGGGTAASAGGPTPHFNAQESVASRPRFIAAESFAGAKPGYVFKQSNAGLGYHLDEAASLAPWETDPNALKGVGSNLTTAPWDVSDAGAPAPKGVSAPAPKANDPWASVDTMDTTSTRVADRIAAQKHQLAAAKSAADAAKREREKAAAAATKQAGSKTQAASKPPAAKPAAGGGQASATTVKPLLDGLGMSDKYAAFEAAGLTDASALAALQQSDPAALAAKLTGAGMKMGQRQKFILALAGVGK